MRNTLGFQAGNALASQAVMRQATTSLFLVLATACSAHDRPGGPTSTETALQTYESCSALEADLKAMLNEEIEAQFDQERYWRDRGGGVWLEDSADGPPSPATGQQGAPRQEGVDYSGTNNQEAGVDEADFVKTDGHHVYVLNGNRLHIYGVPEFGKLVPESVVEVEGYPTQMLLDKDSGRIAIFSQINAAALPEGHPLRASVGERDARGLWMWRVQEVSKITVLEANNRLAPVRGREIYFEGSYQTARLIDRSVRMGSFSYLDVPTVRSYFWGWGDGDDLGIDQREAAAKAALAKLRLDDLVPRIYERLPDKTFNTHAITDDNCGSFHRPTDSQGRGVSSIMSFKLDSGGFELDADHVVSNYATLYASTDRLYISEAAHDWWWFWWNEEDEDVTNIHAFDISKAGQTTYVGSGRIKGRIENSFSMGEKDGLLRVAATTDRFGRWWVDPREQNEAPASVSHVYVLAQQEGKLQQIGHLGGIAPGERIFSARFVGDRAYVVTFRNVDPLFTIDLSDPTEPKILGSLKVPGVSTYIHPLDGGRLLTLGWGGDEQMLNWRPQVSLFDVSDDTRPTLLDTQALTGASTHGWTEALYEHKAFQYWAPKGLLAVPVSSYGNDDRGWGWSYSSHLLLISVGATGLELHGDIDHSRFYNNDKDHFWSFTDVRRSIFMGDFIYAISDRGITVHRLDDLAMVAEQTLPGYRPQDLYWWW